MREVIESINSLRIHINSRFDAMEAKFDSIDKTATRIIKTVSIVESNGAEFVPIRPICEIFGISIASQIEKIKADEILSSTVLLSSTVGADGKQREMFCLPLRYIFGWLFTINPSNVKEDAREAVIQYKRECYDVLFDYYQKHLKFFKYRQEEIERHLDVVKKLRLDFSQSRKNLSEAEKNLDTARALTEEEFTGMLTFKS